MLHTSDTSVIRLNELLQNLSALDKECVTLATLVTEDSSAVEVEVEGLGELSGWVGDEAELCGVSLVMGNGSLE